MSGAASSRAVHWPRVQVLLTSSGGRWRGVAMLNASDVQVAADGDFSGPAEFFRALADCLEDDPGLASWRAHFERVRHEGEPRKRGRPRKVAV